MSLRQRAVNIPEFVNLARGLTTSTRRQSTSTGVDAAQQLQDEHKYAEAFRPGSWLRQRPEDARLNNLGVALAATGKTSDAIEAYKLHCA